MFRITGLFIIVFFLSICQHCLSQGFAIKGKISNVENGVVYLRDVDYNLIDSSIITNGTFFLKGRVQVPDFFTICLNFTPYVDDIFLENKTYQVDIKLNPFQLTSSGGHLDSLFRVFSDSRKLSYFALSQLAKILNDSIWIGKKNLRPVKSELRLTYNFIDSVQFSRDTIFINTILQTWLAPRLIASIMHTRKDLPVLLRYYTVLHDSIKSSPPGNYLLKKIEKLQTSVSPGDEMPAFSVNDQKGKPVKIQAPLRKQYVLIDFWASWCKPCIEEFPVLKIADSTYRSKGFSILSISIDKDIAAWEKSTGMHLLPWQQFIEDKENANRLSKRLKLTGVPANFLIDHNMKIIAINLRGAQLLETLEELLGPGASAKESDHQVLPVQF